MRLEPFPFDSILDRWTQRKRFCWGGRPALWERERITGEITTAVIRDPELISDDSSARGLPTVNAFRRKEAHLGD